MRLRAVDRHCVAPHPSRWVCPLHRSGLALLAILFALAAPAQAARKALVVGIDAYQSIAPLLRAGNDAVAVGRALESVGFEVDQVLDADGSRFEGALADFVQRLDEGDEAVFFFAGHGVALNGQNYLIPADFPRLAPGDDTLVRLRAISADFVIEQFQSRRVGVTLLILDACRDNPFASRTGRSLGAARGLDRMDPPQGTFVLFSAGQGQTALDGLNETDRNPNSVFTRALVPRLTEPGLDIHAVTLKVRAEVQELARRVNHEQFPSYYDQLSGTMTFVSLGTAERAQTPTPSPPQVAASPASAERSRCGRVDSKLLDWDDLLASDLDAALADCTMAQRLHPDDASVMAWLGRVLTARGEYVEALSWNRVAADEGHPAAMNAVGRAFANGEGTTEDDAAAAEWFRRAAEAGDLNGMSNLGNALRDGRGIARDQRAAFGWNLRAAEAGVAGAMFSVGVAYQVGEGVERNQRLAGDWFCRAGEAGLVTAMHNCGIVLGMEGDEAAAYDWLNRAAAEGHPGAMLHAARFVWTQRGDPGDYVDWIVRSVSKEAPEDRALDRLETVSPAYTRELQRYLRDEGYYGGGLDGDFGPATRRALLAFSEARR